MHAYLKGHRLRPSRPCRFTWPSGMRRRCASPPPSWSTAFASTSAQGPIEGPSTALQSTCNAAGTIDSMQASLRSLPAPPSPPAGGGQGADQGGAGRRGRRRRGKQVPLALAPDAVQPDARGGDHGCPASPQRGGETTARAWLWGFRCLVNQFQAGAVLLGMQGALCAVRVGRPPAHRLLACMQLAQSILLPSAHRQSCCC